MNQTKLNNTIITPIQDKEKNKLDMTNDIKLNLEIAKKRIQILRSRLRIFEDSHKKIIDEEKPENNDLLVKKELVTKNITEITKKNKLNDVIINNIREEVKKGKTKIEVANQYGYSYYTVKKYTHGIITPKGISDQLRQYMRDEYSKGKTKNKIAEELHISRDTVIKYTIDMPKNPNEHWKRSDEQIAQIRKYVIKYRSKTKAAKILGLSYSAVKWYTRDIPGNYRLSIDIKNKIRDEVKKGKTKTKIAKEMNVSLSTVSNHTMDICKVQKKADVSYKAFLLLQELINKGYAFPSNHYGYKEYQILKKKFPQLCRVKMHGKVIFFFEEKSEVAVRAFLLALDERITDYFRLKRVINAFKAKMDYDEKRDYIHKNKSKKPRFSKNLKAACLRENADSFVKIKLFQLFNVKKDL